MSSHLIAVLSPSRLYPLPGHLSSVQAAKTNILVFRSFDLVVRSGENDLEVYGVSLIRIDTTVGTVSTAAGFGCLLDIDVADI